MVDEAVEAIGMADFLHRPYGKLSGGQRRRADIAAALLHRPRLLFLDEPTTGLDPQTRLVIWETVKKLQAQSGMTVFLTTHYMEEAAESDYIIVIDHGKIAAKGTPAELKTKYAFDSLRIVAKDEGAMEQLTQQLSEADCIIANFTITIKLNDTMAALPILEKCKQYISAFQVIQGSMDDAFIGITGRDIR
jgi:multidrug/hemolysin transport system ATP-binding protein